MVIFASLSKTILAASGSAYMLNSLLASELPEAKLPPIMTISSIFSSTCGQVLRSTAILVNGPMVTSVIFSFEERIVSFRNSMACFARGLETAGG